MPCGLARASTLHPPCSGHAGSSARLPGCQPWRATRRCACARSGETPLGRHLRFRVVGADPGNVATMVGPRIPAAMKADESRILWQLPVIRGDVLAEAVDAIAAAPRLFAWSEDVGQPALV